MVIIYTYVCKNVLAVCNNDMKWCIHKHCSLLQLLIHKLSNHIENRTYQYISFLKSYFNKNCKEVITYYMYC